MEMAFISFLHTVYAIHFAHRYFHDFGLSGEIRESLISCFSDVFITDILKWTFSYGLTREIRGEKTLKITTYTVFTLKDLHSF